MSISCRYVAIFGVQTLKIFVYKPSVTLNSQMSWYFYGIKMKPSLVSIISCSKKELFYEHLMQICGDF